MGFSFDFSETSKFFDNMQKFKEGMPEFIENEMSYSALKLIMDIKDLTPVDSGALKMAWMKTDVYKTGRQARTYKIDINNKQDYASFVEDGYYTSKTATRYVPGSWNNGKFNYDPNSKTGMVVKRKWIEGRHMFRISANKWERYFEIDFNRGLNNYAKKMKVK